jgi:hypothetical protein
MRRDLGGDAFGSELAARGRVRASAVVGPAITTAPVEAADLPPFTNQSGRCARCAGRGPIRAGIAL